MQRRDFLKLTAGATAVSAKPWLVYSQTTKQVRTQLPIPVLLEAQNGQQLELVVQQGTTNLVAHKATTTFGVNGSFLGPIIKVQQGTEFNIKVTNNLLGRDTVLHYHGVEVPGDVDGGPNLALASGKSRVLPYKITQAAATCWFHSHPHMQTGYQTAMGIGGMYWIEDANSHSLKLPHRYGVDDIPVIMQDKRLNQEGQISYVLNEYTAGVGWVGNRMFVNGAEYPQLKVPQGWIRLRLLNACNARALSLTTSDKRDIFVIASDGGFLAELTPVKELDVLMGERFEILLNTKDAKAFDLVMQKTRQDSMYLPPFDKDVAILTVTPTNDQGVQKISEQLVKVPDLVVPKDINVRRLDLMMDTRAHMAHLAVDRNPQLLDAPSKLPTHTLHKLNKINNLAHDMHKPLFDVPKATYERWIISGAMDTMLHPFHVHGTQFRIISENAKPPLAHRSGWKDTVRVEGLKSEILVKFNYNASKEYPYMAHCHLLEHEDTGMMFGFTVS